MRIFQAWLSMLQQPFISIKYFGCSLLVSVSIVLKGENFPDISGLPDFSIEQFLTFQIFQISEQRQKKMPEIIEENIWWTLN